MEMSEASLTAPGRRTFLRRATTAGAAVTIGSVVVPIGRLIAPAAAQEDAVTIKDDDLAAFAESVELGLVEAYRQAAAGGKITTPALTTLVTAFGRHHQEHAGTLAASAGAKATHVANAKLVGIASDQLRTAPSETATVKVLFDLENAASATYMFALGSFESQDAARLVASILPVEAQHAAVLGRAIGQSDEIALPPFEVQDGSFDYATYTSSEAS
jgi:hypothetical protein